jgi:hypothetical protein
MRQQLCKYVYSCTVVAAGAQLFTESRTRTGVQHAHLQQSRAVAAVLGTAQSSCLRARVERLWLEASRSCLNDNSDACVKHTPGAHVKHAPDEAHAQSCASGLCLPAVTPSRDQCARVSPTALPRAAVAVMARGAASVMLTRPHAGRRQISCMAGFTRVDVAASSAAWCAVHKSAPQSLQYCMPEVQTFKFPRLQPGHHRKRLCAATATKGVNGAVAFTDEGVGDARLALFNSCVRGVETDRLNRLWMTASRRRRPLATPAASTWS